jgi:uncharacterized protein (TIGR02646 family)
MIRIDRGPLPPTVKALCVPTVPAEDGQLVTKAEFERRRAQAYFGDPKKFANNQKLTDEKFKFDVYKDRDLSRELDRIFSTKCAYCETNFGAVMPKDVEHFRPKSEVTTETGALIPGYYWLAADWDNLLVSCGDCNRGRILDVVGQPKPVKRGKSTQFPLANEAARVRNPGPEIGNEEPARLLIDPCREEPADHLTFDEEGFVYPKPDAAGIPSLKGEASIYVYALERSELVQRRKAAINQLIFDVRQLKKAVARAGRAQAKGRKREAAEELETVTDFKIKIAEMLRPQAEYLGMLREWLARTKAAGGLSELERFGIDLTASDLVV